MINLLISFVDWDPGSENEGVWWSYSRDSKVEDTLDAQERFFLVAYFSSPQLENYPKEIHFMIS